MATYMTELLNRCVALQKEAMATINVPCDAVPYFFHWQEKGPYFTNRIPDTPIERDGSEETDLNKPTVIMRLVIGHITESYKGIPEAKLYEWLPVVKTYFQEHMWLQTSTATYGNYTARMDNIFADDTRVTNGGGLRAFDNQGINQIQVGGEIILSCTILEELIQAGY